MALNTDIHLRNEDTLKVTATKHDNAFTALAFEVRQDGNRQGTVTFYCHTAEHQALAQALGAIANLAKVSAEIAETVSA